MTFWRFIRRAWGVVAALAAAAILGVMLFMNHATVGNGSMVPALPVGSEIFVVGSGAYRPSDIVLVRDDKSGARTQLFTHRLVETKADGSIVTKGDANQNIDPVRRVDGKEVPLTTADIQGKVVYTMPWGKEGIAAVWLLCFVIALWGLSAISFRHSKRSASSTEDVLD